nr:hypothetical protein [Tanacetum cinerariifolium]
MPSSSPTILLQPQCPLSSGTTPQLVSETPHEPATIVKVRESSTHVANIGVVGTHLLGYTYSYICMLQNPTLYGLPDTVNLLKDIRADVKSSESKTFCVISELEFAILL